MDTGSKSTIYNVIDFLESSEHSQICKRVSMKHITKNVGGPWFTDSLKKKTIEVD
jgi:hypothetical protein